MEQENGIAATYSNNLWTKNDRIEDARLVRRGAKSDSERVETSTEIGLSFTVGLKTLDVRRVMTSFTIFPAGWKRNSVLTR